MNKLLGSILALATFAGIVVGFESRYALAADMLVKADAKTVQDLQVMLMEDKLEELEFDKFELENKPVLNDSEQFKLNQIKVRINKVQRRLK